MEEGNGGGWGEGGRFRIWVEGERRKVRKREGERRRVEKSCVKEEKIIGGPNNGCCMFHVDII